MSSATKRRRIAEGSLQDLSNDIQSEVAGNADQIPDTDNESDQNNSRDFDGGDTTHALQILEERLGDVECNTGAIVNTVLDNMCPLNLTHARSRNESCPEDASHENGVHHGLRRANESAAETVRMTLHDVLKCNMPHEVISLGTGNLHMDCANVSVCRGLVSPSSTNSDLKNTLEQIIHHDQSDGNPQFEDTFSDEGCSGNSQYEDGEPLLSVAVIEPNAVLAPDGDSIVKSLNAKVLQQWVDSQVDADDEIFMTQQEETQIAIDTRFIDDADVEVAASEEIDESQRELRGHDTTIIDAG